VFVRVAPYSEDVEEVVREPELLFTVALLVVREELLFVVEVVAVRLLLLLLGVALRVYVEGELLRYESTLVELR